MNKNATLGWLHVLQPDGKIFNSFATLELPWKNNQPGVSCVPAGEYDLVLERSPKFRTSLWELKGVPDRAEAKFHAANFISELEGCIAVGTEHSDINGDGVVDVINSRAALRKLHYTLSGMKATTIKIVNYDLKEYNSES